MELFEGLSVPEQEALFERLVAFALRLLRNRSVGGLTCDSNAEDVVYEVLLKYLQGTRRLNPNCTLEQNLQGGVRSLIWSAQQRVSASYRQVRLEEYVGCPLASPEQRVSWEQRRAKVYTALWAQAAEDEELGELVCGLQQNGLYTVGDLLIDCADVRDAQRKRRKLSRALQRAVTQLDEPCDEPR